MSETLKINNLRVSVDGKEILKGVDLEIHRGETHALMGPNGCGKTTLGYTIMGHPGYEVTDGSIELHIEDAGGTRVLNVLEMEPNERARAGVFLAFQRPMSIPGVKMARRNCLWRTRARSDGFLPDAQVLANLWDV
jgi:Fe-S cluster assembly ATP-binding protein